MIFLSEPSNKKVRNFREVVVGPAVVVTAIVADAYVMSLQWYRTHIKIGSSEEMPQMLRKNVFRKREDAVIGSPVEGTITKRTDK